MVIVPRLRHLVTCLRTSPVVVLAIALEIALAIGAPDRTFLIRTFFAQLVLVFIWLAGELLVGPRKAFVTASVWAALVALTAILDPAGPYDVQGARIYRDLPPGAVLSARYYTHRESGRWQSVDRTVMQPYAYLSVRSLSESEDILIQINGAQPRSLVRGSGARRVGSGYALPLSWEDIDAGEFVALTVRFVHDGAKPLKLFTGPYMARGWWHLPQTVTIGAEERLVPEYLKTQSNMVLEIRIADTRGLVAAILY